MGRLSNPPEVVATIADLGRSGRRRISRATEGTPGAARTPLDAGPPEERGRLSNPVQRRLSRTEIEQLIGQYRHGSSIDTLSRRYEIHRTTVMHHLNQSDVARRTVVRKMSDETVTLAAAQYERGASLAAVAGAFGVHERTLAREFRRAGVAIRPRRGWRP
jgi:AraC-like DNA-binding protein